MQKPIFRWTIGKPNKNGIDILKTSIKYLYKIYGDTFNYFVCYNNLEPKQLEEIKKLNVPLYPQTWDMNPLPVQPENYQGISNKPNGSLWKICPPRINIKTHEIIMDNDVIITKKLNKIDEFLSSNQVLILEDLIKYYGIYDSYFKNNEHFNSGVMGLPPNYDFSKKILETYLKREKPKNFQNGDEQGLLMLTLYNEKNPIFIRKNEIVELHSHKCLFCPQKYYQFNSGESGMHFVEANRINKHIHWDKFKRFYSYD